MWGGRPRPRMDRESECGATTRIILISAMACVLSAARVKTRQPTLRFRLSGPIDKLGLHCTYFAYFGR
jgi:hypothetical protein